MSYYRNVVVIVTWSQQIIIISLPGPVQLSQQCSLWHSMGCLRSSWVLSGYSTQLHPWQEAVWSSLGQQPANPEEDGRCTYRDFTWPSGLCSCRTTQGWGTVSHFIGLCMLVWVIWLSCWKRPRIKLFWASAAPLLSFLKWNQLVLLFSLPQLNYSMNLAAELCQVVNSRSLPTP